MSYCRRRHGEFFLPCAFQDFAEDIQSSLRGFLPTEVRGALEAQPFHTGAQFAVQQEVGNGTDHLVDGIRVKDDGRAIHNLG